MKLNHQSEKYCENVNQSDIIFQCSENICHAYFVNKFCDNYNKVSYLPINKKCSNLETTFRKKVNFSQ